MLDDSTRKVLRVLFNRKRNEWFVMDVAEIARYALRTETQVKSAINELVQQSYLEWNKEARAFRVLKSTEDEPPILRHWHHTE